MSKDKAYLLLDTKIAEEFHEQAMKTSEYPLDYGNMSNFMKKLRLPIEEMKLVR